MGVLDNVEDFAHQNTYSASAATWTLSVTRDSSLGLYMANVSPLEDGTYYMRISFKRVGKLDGDLPRR